MDQTNFKHKLRDELAVPLDLDPAQRVATLEEAFRPFEFRGESSAGFSALAYLSEGDTLDFFGTLTLHRAFGKELWKRGFGPSWLVPASGEEWIAGLRRRAYRYAVIGRESHTRYQKTRQLAVTVALRLTSRLLYREATDALDGAVETMKLRSGLMNKIQAQLLADHLNHVGVSKSHITWHVVEGPAPDTSSRAWLNDVGPMAPLLRRESGETAAWSLGAVAQRGIVTYRLENGPVVSPSQVFSVQSPRVIVPPRYILNCGLSSDIELPWDGTVGIAARRDASCEDALQLCELITDANLDDDYYWSNTNPNVDFTNEVRDFFKSTEKRYFEDSPQAYSLGFDSEEAERAIKHLHASGLGEFFRARTGAGGNFNPLQLLDCAPLRTLPLADDMASRIEVVYYRS